MLKRLSLTKQLISSYYVDDSLIQSSNGYFKAYVTSPLSLGIFEEGLDGPMCESFSNKITELLGRLPNFFEGQIIYTRSKDKGSELPGFISKIYVLEKVRKKESYSHFDSILRELGFTVNSLDYSEFRNLLASFLGQEVQTGHIPDLIWEKEKLSIGRSKLRSISLTELPQITWFSALQELLEIEDEFTLSLKFSLPDRAKVKKQLETKRRVSHALSVKSAAEVHNIESNSVLSSSEETLERILVSKESLFEISLGIFKLGKNDYVTNFIRNVERIGSSIGNAGLYPEEIGNLPVLRSHLPGNKILGIRKLPILSENLSHLMPLLLDYSRASDRSHLELRSRSGEVSYLNLFSSENLNFNSFICGASGSGKSFLMNAILQSNLKDEPKTKLVIFDIGGSYQNLIKANKGAVKSLNSEEAIGLISNFLKNRKIDKSGFFSTLIETFCGSGSHISHSHRVAIQEILNQLNGKTLSINEFIKIANSRSESFYKDLAHWLSGFTDIDGNTNRDFDLDLFNSQLLAFDFKELDSNPTIQRATILLLSHLTWLDLIQGKYPKSLIVFDEVWRFFSQSQSFLEEMYRTLRKYRAGIVSITQNLSDYGNDKFAKMLFTNSYTKIFLQNGASAEYLKDTFDLAESDIQRALSVTSKKPYYSEFYSLTPNISQVFRLHPTEEFYKLANTENISIQKKDN